MCIIVHCNMKWCVLISFFQHFESNRIIYFHSIFFKMIKLLFLLLLVPVLVVKSSNVNCLKAYKRKLCFKVSLQSYQTCLFRQFIVFEYNNQFCVSNTKCVSKISSCFGWVLLHSLFKINLLRANYTQIYILFETFDFKIKIII